MLCAIFSCTPAHTPATPAKPAPAPEIVEVRAAANDVSYRIILAGRSPTLEGRVVLANDSPRPWERVRLAIDLDIVRPPLDPDGDGIPNDLCPHEAERYNGLDDDDGCADGGQVITQPLGIEILHRILFKPGRTTIDAAARPLLDRVVETLDTVPSLLSVDVEGHADRGEPHAANLAKARATSVRDALIARGAEAGRLVAVGRAAEQPHDTSKPDFNRRVVFVVRKRGDEHETVGSAWPPAPPDLPASAVQRLLRVAARAGSTRHISIELVSAPAQSEQTVWFLRAPIDATRVQLWSPGDRDLARGVRVINRTSWTLPSGAAEVMLGASSAGTATMLETLEPGQSTIVAYARGDKAPMTRNVAERVQSARIIGVSLGFTIVERQLVRTTTFSNDGRELIFALHKKGATRIAAQLPAGTVDIGDAWWLPVAPGTLAVEEREIRRHRVRLLDALPRETEPYLDDPALPADVAKALREVMALRTSLLAEPSRSVQHYELRAKLRALLATIRFGS